MKLRTGVVLASLGSFCLPNLLQMLAQAPMNSPEVAWAVHYDPKTLDPAKVDDEVSEQVRYLTGGVLVRLNRTTMKPEPELADSWQISADGRTIKVHLREGLRFSDGAEIKASDVVATFHRVLSPATGAPVAAEFVEPAKVTCDTLDEHQIVLHLPARLVNLAAVLDEIAIEPKGQPTQAGVTAGPFVVTEYRRGEWLKLHRNPFYWRHAQKGQSLPYLSSLRLDVLENRDTEELRFMRGQYQLINNIAPEAFTPLHKRMPGETRDLGPSLNTEQMWFNLAPQAPLPDYEKKWFASTGFRKAVSLAIQRDDLARVAFEGHATPANGFISPKNSDWYNRALPSPHQDLNAALRLLAADGFQRRGPRLFDRQGHAVKFSLLTNAGNRARARMASLIQQDMAAIGVDVNVVTMDFPALIERLMHSSDYEAALLGLSNVQPDPSTMMNIWLSSSPNHQWNPNQKAPATPWEAEIDKAMRLQAETSDEKVRKSAVDRVQQLVAENVPFIYLVYPNTLCAVSTQLQGEQVSVLQPAVLSGIETMRWREGSH